MKNPKGKRWIKTSLPLGMGERVGFNDKGQAVYMFLTNSYVGPIKDEDIIAESDIRDELLKRPVKRGITQ